MSTLLHFKFLIASNILQLASAAGNNKFDNSLIEDDKSTLILLERAYTRELKCILFAMHVYSIWHLYWSSSNFTSAESHELGHPIFYY